MGQKHARELAKNKRCKCDCPDGISISVKVLDGMRIIYDDGAAKDFPTLEMIGNIKVNYPCE